jgi:hypothetical protein
MDEFRLIDGGGTVLVTPGISPIFGQNPAFQTYGFAPDGSVTDRVTYSLPDLKKAGWQREYDFDQTWGVKQLDALALSRVFLSAVTQPAARTRWLSLYAVSHAAFWQPSAAALPEPAARAYLCAAGHTEPGAYLQCWCAGAN